MSRLIYAPTIKVIGATEFYVDGVVDWVEEIGLGHALLDPTSTLSVLLTNAREGKVSSMDLLIEFAGRMCYRSFFKGRDTKDYLLNILEMMHGSVMEHASINFAIAGVSRSFSHELVRHRAGTAVSQESQRYVDANDIKFVVPVLLCDTFLNDDVAASAFEKECLTHLDNYKQMQVRLKFAAHKHGWEGRMLTKRVNEAAREVLPNMAETRMVWTCNLREMRHVLMMRGSDQADLQFMRVASILSTLVKGHTTHLFSDIQELPSEHLPFGPLTSKYGRV